MAVALVALVASAVPAYRTPRTAPRAVVAALGYSGAAVASRAATVVISRSSSVTQLA